MLIPQKFLSTDREAVRGFARHPLLSTVATEVRGRLLTSIADDQLPQERERNDRKAKWTKRASMLPTERPTPGDWEIAYVVTTRGRRRDDLPYTLPFFSLADLASSAKRLQDRGFKVSVAEVRES